MDKSAIRNFAIEARKMLMKSAETEAGFYGVTKNGCKSPIQKWNDFEVYETIAGTENRIYGADIKRRANLVKAVETLGFEQVIEETAYTWFNRIIAIRFMEVNDYLPTRVRVLSSETGSNTPDIVTQSLDVDLNMTPEELEKVQKAKDENRYDDAFRMLFIKQCNELNAILPGLFEKTDDYMELLLKLSYTSDGVVRMLVDSIDENNFNVETEGQVEIIGWMYQYYISEKHDEIINIYKGTIKKADIPAATQLFTTDWVVRYMVDNSLGRYWIERKPESNLAEKLDYFVSAKDREINYIDETIEPLDIKFFDPCMGSGHILVYAFDVLMEIYRECGYSDRDAALCIVQNNLYGMDIDKRAYQLAYFAVMMKARGYNRRALTQGVSNNLAVCEESNSIDKFYCEGLTTDKEKNEIGEYLIEVFRDAQELGTLQTIKYGNYKAFAEYLLNIESNAEQFDIFTMSWMMDVLPKMLRFAKQAYIMSQKFEVVCTNPPYLGKLEGRLKDFVMNKYKEYSGDLFSVFMFRNFGFCKENGYSAFMTPFVWMFIKSYEELRNYIIKNKSITSLVQMEYSAFEEATVPICSFVLKNGAESRNGLYFRLSEFRGGMEVQKKKVLEALDNPSCGYYYEADQKNFMKIPGIPVAYWLSETTIAAFAANKLYKNYEARNGITTGQNDLFIRYWFEIDRDTGKWFKCNKGGAFRRWYGNQDFVIDWENDGWRLKNFKDDKGKQRSTLRSIEYNFNQAITMSRIGSGISSFRWLPEGFITEGASNNIYFSSLGKEVYNLLAFLNSKSCEFILKLYNPTINVMPDDLRNLPLAYQDDTLDLSNIVKECISLCKSDWDEYETSWDFKIHPFVSMRLLNNGCEDTHAMKLELIYKSWETFCKERFDKLKENEEELNRIFIEIYGLQEDVTPDVEDKDVTVRKADLQRDIKSLLSYAVGCMFGRYSLDMEGVAYAGGVWNDSRYQTFMPDKDNCIPITDEEYFEDDIVGLFCKWLKVIYGETTLEENLDFIAKALGNKGSTSREVIRNYFLTDFIKDHIKIYQKRPIYWLFDSGKQNGFKALVYMHRYNKDTLNVLRSQYLHKMEEAVENSLKNAEYIIQTSTSAVERAKATKGRDRYVKQLNEMRIYYQALSHLALQKIEFDLDDGVKDNYQLFQGIEAIADGGKKQKVDLLAKI